MIDLIYFDNAATTYPKPEVVVKALEEGIIKYSFNAGRGQYKEAKELPPHITSFSISVNSKIYNIQ